MFPIETNALCNAANFAEPSCRFGGHEIFPEDIGVLDYGALERLKNYAALFQVIRNDVALDELIVRENHSTRVLVETTGILQNIVAVVFRKRRAYSKRRQIEKTDIRESPWLIFSRRVRQCFELLPRCALLITKPIWKIARFARAGENRCCLLLMCD